MQYFPHTVIHPSGRVLSRSFLPSSAAFCQDYLPSFLTSAVQEKKKTLKQHLSQAWLLFDKKRDCAVRSAVNKIISNLI